VTRITSDGDKAVSLLMRLSSALETEIAKLIRTFLV